MTVHATAQTYTKDRPAWINKILGKCLTRWTDRPKIKT